MSGGGERACVHDSEFRARHTLRPTPDASHTYDAAGTPPPDDSSTMKDVLLEICLAPEGVKRFSKKSLRRIYGLLMIQHRSSSKHSRTGGKNRDREHSDRLYV